MDTISKSQLIQGYDYHCAVPGELPFPNRGGKKCKEGFSNELSPLSAEYTTQSLSDLTIETLRRCFAERSHAPSEQMWRALRAVADTLESMADEKCASAIYLSSLDPGVGKTTAVIAFLKALIASREHVHVGAIVCVGRLSQIATIVDEAQLSRADFAVLTSDKSLNELGCNCPQRARILFTTHSMVEHRCIDRRFSDVSALHYRGTPRLVRIWDEAILPGQTLTVNRDTLGLLFEPIRARNSAMADAVEDLFNKLREAQSGTIIQIPELDLIHGLGLNDALGLVEDGLPKQKHAVERLWFLFGKHVTIRRDGPRGNTMLDYRDTLPDDIKPLLVLDASARVRTVYRCWKEDRGGIVELPTAPKRYTDLTIHVLQRGGGKGAFRKEAKRLVEIVATTIQMKPEEKWLVIGHKNSIDMDLETDVRALLPSAGPNVRFVHWGAHDATNAYADATNVILAGTLFYPVSHYEALGRLASAYPSSLGQYAREKTHGVMLGEHRHLILQATCRGAVRRCIGDACPPTNVYLIASAKSGIAEQLPNIFPGARICTWKAARRALRGKVSEAVAFLSAEFESCPDSVVAFRRVMDHIGWKDSREFKRSIRRHDDFVATIEEIGVEEWGPGRYPTCFRKRPQ
jgi:hypothetical protein